VDAEIATTSVLIENEEDGYLDLLEMGQEKFNAMNESQLRMAGALQDLTEKLNARTQEVNEAKSQTGKLDLQQAKRFSNLVAEEMNNFARRMDTEIPVFAQSYSSATDAYTRAFSFAENSQTTEAQDASVAKSAIQEFQSVLAKSKSQLVSFRETVSSIPRLTKVLNRAKRTVISTMDKWDHELSTALNLTSETEKLIDRLIQPSAHSKAN